MLTLASIEASRPIADNAIGNNGGFDVVPGSPLSVLLLQMRPIIDVSKVEDGNQSKHILDASRPVQKGEFDPHTGELQTMGHGISNLVAGSIKFARTVINPMIREIIEKCEDAKREINSHSPVNLNVRHLDTHPIYTDATVEQYLEPFKRGNGADVDIDDGLRNRILEGFNDEVFMTATAGPSATFTTRLKSLLQTMDGGVAEYLFSPYRQQTGTAAAYTEHSSLLTFLFLKGIIGGRYPSVDINSYTLEERTLLSKAMSFYAMMTFRQIKQVTDFAVSGKFILPGATDQFSITVVDSTYRQWLKTGGSAEALIGFVAKNQGKVAGRDRELIDNPELAVVYYDRIVKQTTNTNRLLSTASIESIVSRHISTIIAEADVEPAEKIEQQEELKRLCETYRYVGSKDLVDYVRYMVCATRGKDTDAYSLLCGIDAYLEDNPEATMGEAALHSSMQVAAKWVASQIIVVKSDSFSDDRPTPLSPSHY